MKLLINRRLIVAVLSMGCLMSVLLMAVPTRSSTLDLGQYDKWADVTGPTVGIPDGTINMRDIAYEILLFNTHGTPINRSAVMSLEYDTGWIDITDKCGQYFNVTHNLNSTDLIVDVQGKTTLDSGPHQKYYGLTGYTPGWSKTYGGPSDEQASTLVQTVDGGYALAGYTYSFGAGQSDAWLVKTDTLGNMQWNRTYGGTGYDFAYALMQTTDGGYALTGSSDSFGAGSDDFWLVKTDAGGNMQWNQTYGGSYREDAYALVQTTDGGYALAGFTTFGGAWLVKTDASGNMQWNKTYGGTISTYAYALVQTGDGGYALAGAIGVGYADFWLVKTDAGGNMQWNKTYGGTYGDEATTLLQTGDGGYALAGWTNSFGAGSDDFWLVKTDAGGNMQWNKTYGGPDREDAYALVQTSDDGYALTGLTGNAWLVKTDANGNMQWNKTYGGSGGGNAYALVQTTDGGYALAETKASFDAGNYDFWLVKTDVESGLAWVDSTANTITLYRGITDIYWNYVRVRLWKPQ